MDVKISTLKMLWNMKFKVIYCFTHTSKKFKRFQFHFARPNLFLYKKTKNAINDPLGQTYSRVSSNHYSHFKFVLFCEILKNVDGRTDPTCENSDHYRPWLWVGLVDQYPIENALFRNFFFVSAITDPTMKPFSCRWTEKKVMISLCLAVSFVSTELPLLREAS